MGIVEIIHLRNLQMDSTMQRDAITMQIPIAFFTRKHFSLSFFFFFEITIKKRTSNKLNGIECLLLLNEILTRFIDQRKKIIGFWNEKNLTTFNSQHLSISLSC